MKNFWLQLPRPFFVQAPMINVTDAAFRRVIAQHGKPDVMMTEFTSVDGLCSEGRKALRVNLDYTPAERPIVLQIFGATPANFTRVAEMAQQLGFDGIDINMGCPDKAVVKQCAGAALIRTPELAQEIIRATKAGAGELPVSVKTRIGFAENTLETWLPALLAAEPAVVTVHARTKREMSDVPARWDVVKRAVEIRDAAGSSTLIVGNGDVLGLDDARAKVAESGADGAMLGRALFGNPWAFSRTTHKLQLPYEEIIRAMLDHARLFEELFGPEQPREHRKNFLIMRKHFGAYVAGFPRAKSLRARLMETECAKDVEAVVEWYLSQELPAVRLDAPSELAHAAPQTWRPSYSSDVGQKPDAAQGE